MFALPLCGTSKRSGEIMKTLLFVAILFLSTTSFALFESQEHLFTELSNCGIKSIVDIGDRNSKANIYNLSTSPTNPQQIARYEYQYTNAIRIPELDSMISGFTGKRKMEAYSIEENILCYKVSSESTIAFIAQGSKYEKCFVLSATIEHVLAQLESRP